MTRPVGTDAADDGRIAVGWATVELERAEAEWLPRLPPGTTFQDAPASVHLGARCRMARLGSDATAEMLVLLEPATEGRLAATLARSGEGWCATWTAAPSDGDDAPTSGATDLADTWPHRPAGAAGWSVERPGPFGPERLDLAGPVHGPHRLVVRRATIEP